MVLRGVALLAVARGVVAQCTVSGVSAPSNGELSADCPSDGSTVADGASMACYICDYGFTFSGTQPSCAGTTFSAGSNSCQANMCDSINLDGQYHLGTNANGVGMLTAAATCTRENACSTDNAYRTGRTVDQSTLDSAVQGAFSCADGYELDSQTLVEFVCNYATSEGGAASFTGQLCTPVTCAACTGTADDGTTCDLDAATDGTAACPTGCVYTTGSIGSCTGMADDNTMTCDLDAATDGTASCPAGCVYTAPWCAFVQDQSNRADGVDCTADSSHVWCQCLQSAAERLGVSDFGSDAHADWLNDGQCHPIFDTGLCHRDGGDCSGAHTSACEAELRDVIRPACCTTADCTPVPDTVTESCARLMVPFWARCAYEVELPYLPMWVWGGLAAYSDSKLDSTSAYCASQPSVPYTLRQRCDAHCDCGMLDPSDPDSCSDEMTDIHGDPCEYPDAPATSFCTNPVSNSDKVCTCNSGVEIPFEWLCDGSDDCGMGEDETTSACGETNANDLVVWGETFNVTGARRTCISRWGREVASACSSSTFVDEALQSTCSAACADVYLDWYFDCKHVVFNVAGSTVYETQANQFFDCCLDAQAAGADRTCASVGEVLDSCEGGSDIATSLAISNLGNNVCDPELDCEAYLEDAGDCATRVTVTLPFAAEGTFSANDFVSALITPHEFLQHDDISVIHYKQTINAALNLGCSFNGAVSAVLLSSPAGQAQLVSGIASWLGVQKEIVSIGEITSSTVDGNEVVSVNYTVTDALKDISEEYSASASARAADLLGYLDRANPQVIPVDLASCGTHFTDSAPAPAPEVVTSAISVQTSILVQVEIVEPEYELVEGTLAGTDPERALDMQNTITAALQDAQTILQYLNSAAQCDPPCITGLEPQTDQLTATHVTPEGGSTIAEFTESEAALAVAIVLVLVLGGCACCITLAACTWYWYKRKQKRQVLLIDQAGNILKEWEDEADSAEREVLMSVLHHYIEEQDKATKEAQEREEEELIATLEAYEVIEDALVAVPVEPEEEDDLLALAEAEAEAAKKERDARRRKAQEKLAKRRAALLERKKEMLEAAGVDEADVAEIVSEIAEADSEADQRRADLESTLDEKQIQEESKKRTEFERKVAAASSDEERADLEDAYKKDMEKLRADIDAERSSKRAKLNERLKQRKAAAQAKMDEKMEGKDVAISAGDGAQLDAEEAQLEEDASAELIDDETCGKLSEAFEKDAAQLKATRNAKKAAAQAKLEERRKAMAAKHKRELEQAGAPPEVVEKQIKELDDQAALENKQVEQQDRVMKKKEQAALAELKAKEEAELAAAEDEELRAQISANFTKEQAEIKKKNMATKQKQRSKLNERLAKRQQQLDKKHKAELQTVAPEAVHVAEKQSEERAALAELQKKLEATQEELAAERASHQAALEALASKHDEELRMQQHKFEAMKREFEELSKQKFEHVDVAGFAGDEHSAATQAVLGEYQMTLEAATKKTKANKVESKAALQARLEKKRKQMEAKARIAMQKIEEDSASRR